MPADPLTHPRAIRAWCLYDWANSAFATTVMVALFPPFFRGLATSAGLGAAQATAYWGYATALALLLGALIGPVLGAIADRTGSVKRQLGLFTALGVLLTAALTLIGGGAWRLAAGLFVLANVAYAGAIVFYESLLPRITTPGELDRVSSQGYAWGYVGGGLLLLVNAIWIMRPHAFGLSGADAAVRISFLSVAVWWAVFSIPLFRRVPEPTAPNAPADAAHAAAGATASAGPLTLARDGFARVFRTLREVRRHRQLFLFLAAFWLYNDGIGTVIKMATAYGDEIGIALRDMVAALLLTQLVAVPCTLLFGRIAGRIGAKRTILITLAVYGVICIGGYFVRAAWHFYALAIAVGMVQGGAQALSRSLFASMVPRERSAEFFGFFSTSGKLAGIVGPLIFGVVGQAMGHSRLGVLSLIVLFVAGAALLWRVDVETGMRAAGNSPDAAGMLE
jgi:UMF1 family MFS transporter